MMLVNSLVFSALYGGVEAASPAESFRFSRRSPHTQSVDTNYSRPPIASLHFDARSALRIRGGDDKRGSQLGEDEEDGQPEDSDGDGPPALDAGEEEYEYEYEYYQVADGEDYDDSEFEYEYYEEEEEEQSSCNYGRVQDINGEFVDSDMGITDDSLTSDEEENTSADESEGEKSKESNRWFFSQWNERENNQKTEPDIEGNAKDDDAKHLRQKEHYQESSELNQEEEYEEYLFTTPIPSFNEFRSPRILQTVNRTVPKNIHTGEAEHYNEERHFDEDNLRQEEPEYRNPHDYLIDGNVDLRPKATSISEKTESHSPWWHHRRQMKESKQSKRKQWRPNSPSMASFVPPLFSSGPSPRSFSLHSSGGRPVYSEWLHSMTTGIVAIVRPIGNGCRKITYSIACTVRRGVSHSISLLRNSLELLWCGPVDGVTTMGITTREGGLRGLLLSSHSTTAISFIALLGLVALISRRLWHQTSSMSFGGGVRNKEFDEDDYNIDEDFLVEGPPSVEEELEFLNSKFDSVNPSSKDRITKAITKQSQLSWPWSRRDYAKSRRGQRQFTIKSIQTWWKERPSQRSIAIIEPQHIHSQQPTLTQEIKWLQKHLAVSEQERAILQQDVQRLQLKLQKAQHDARSIISQNKWLEKQTSQADRILTKAVEVERMKANEELGRVRESVKGVLERERMLMRGRIEGYERRDNFGGRTDVDLNKGLSTRQLEGVKSRGSRGEGGEGRGQ